MFRTKLVLPIEGRAAMITRSPGCRPEVISSRSAKPGRHAGDEAACAAAACSIVVEAALHQLAQRHEAAANALVGDLEDRASPPDRALRRRPARPRTRVARILFASEISAAQRRLFLDDPRVVLDVASNAARRRRARDVGRPADLVELAGCAQLFLQRDEIDRVGLLVERDHLRRRCGGAPRGRNRRASITSAA